MQAHNTSLTHAFVNLGMPIASTKKTLTILHGHPGQN